MKKTATYFFILLLLTLLLIFAVDHELSLLHFINMSFYVGGAVLFIGILGFVTQKGFFDGISYSFRRIFRAKYESGDELEDIPRLSGIVSMDLRPALFSGLLLLAIMMVSLYIYYL
ncbi:protein of unknown function [Bacillus sp. OV322]|uniref:DUF3899 domain-containing protein n=1 Tax=Bacillus sp. OV322 TaxID=1882764 RepID=UPI0008E67B2A|nr:DUF3899 domain-containing protein [Bacillus sp. OV322]SFB97685.1 protein of unknown function [Bacillus sp. OV322]